MGGPRETGRDREPGAGQFAQVGGLASDGGGVLEVDLIDRRDPAVRRRRLVQCHGELLTIVTSDNTGPESARQGRKPPVLVSEAGVRSSGPDVGDGGARPLFDERPVETVDLLR